MQTTINSQSSGSQQQTVVCIHSSGNSSKQWRALEQSLPKSFKVLAVDLHGAGNSPDWAGGRLQLEDEIALLEPSLRKIDGPFHLVGHSYGGAIASRIALIAPERVQSLCLFEPVLFRLLNEPVACEAARDNFGKLQHNVKSHMWSRRPEAAAQFFINYWSGPGSWEAMPAWAKKAMVRKMPKILQELGTPRWDKYDLVDYRTMPVPTLLLWGEHTPAATREITRLLMRHLPNARGAELQGVGHMGPVTHPQTVNPLINNFLTRHVAMPVEYLPRAA